MRAISRKGITPVVATTLLILLTVASVGTVYTMYQELIGSTSSDVSGNFAGEIELIDTKCKINEGSPDKVYLLLKNNAQSSFSGEADVTIYENERPYITLNNLDWSEEKFTEPGQRSLITLNAAEPGSSKQLQRGRNYNIEVSLPPTDGPLTGLCTPRKEIEIDRGSGSGGDESGGDGTDGGGTSGGEDSSGSDPTVNAPTVEDNYTLDGWSGKAQPVELTCSDQETSCSNIEWELYDGNQNRVESNTATGSQTELLVGENNDGGLELRYRGTDTDGNTGSWNSQIIKIDKTPPSTYIADTEAWYSSDFTKAVDDGDNDASGVESCTYRVKDGTSSWTNWMDRSCGSVSISVGQQNTNLCSQQGRNNCTVQVQVESNAGRSETSTASYNIDYTNPNVQITGPDQSQTYSSNFTVNFDASDQGSLDECRYRVNQDIWWPTSCSSGSFDVHVGSNGECSETGSCRIDVRATDQAGNSVSQTANYNIELQGQSTDLSTNIVGPSSSELQTNDFTVSANDAGANLQSCSYRTNNNQIGWTNWQSRNCPNGLFTIEVGANQDCRTSGTNICEVQTRVTNSSGASRTSSTTYSISTSADRLTFQKDEVIDLYQTNSQLVWGKQKTYRVNQLTMYERTLGIGENYNISAYGSSGESVTTTIWTHNLNTFSYGEPIIKIQPSSTNGGTAQFSFTGATQLGSGNYALYEDGSKVKDLSSGGELSWQHSWSTTGNLTIVPETN